MRIRPENEEEQVDHGLFSVFLLVSSIIYNDVTVHRGLVISLLSFRHVSL
jgi:hypothetical protein